MAKWLSLLFYFVVIAALLIFKDDIVSFMKQGSGSIAIMLLLAIVFALFPVLPYSIVIGLCGYAFGTLGGALLCWFAAWTAAILFYLYVRYFFQEQGKRLLERNSKIQAFTARTGRRPFLLIMLARLIPVLPQQLVNIYAAVTGIPLSVYAAATALGKLPAMLIYAFAGEHLLGYLFDHL